MGYDVNLFIFEPFLGTILRTQYLIFILTFFIFL